MDSIGQANSTRIEKAAAHDKCIDAVNPQMRTAKGSQGYQQSKSTEVQALVRSLLLRQPTLFMTLFATDSLWLDFLIHAFPKRTPSEIAAMTKTECSEALVENPDLAVEHFNAR